MYQHKRDIVDSTKGSEIDLVFNNLKIDIETAYECRRIIAINYGTVDSSRILFLDRHS